jgi:hypothetical protein
MRVRKCCLGTLNILVHKRFAPDLLLGRLEIGSLDNVKMREGRKTNNKGITQKIASKHTLRG